MVAGGSAKKKRQHYVPRLILREFSQDGRSISLVVIGTGQRVDGASVANQCYEDYFYGMDGALEDAFGSAEGDFKSAVSDLGREHLEGLSDADIVQIRLFVHYQAHRTFGAAEEADALADGLAKRILAAGRDFDEEDLENIHISLTKPQFLNLYQAASLQPLLLDLEVKFLISEKDLGLIVSDHPVVQANHWAEHHPDFRGFSGTHGIALRGLQWFLPLSPKVCLAIYDPGTYCYGSPKRRTCTIGLHDIRLLNTLQALNAQECIYFDPEATPTDELERVQRERHQYGPPRKYDFSEGKLVQPDGSTGDLVRFTGSRPRLGRKFSFAQITDKSRYPRYDRIVLPVRSEELFALMKEWSATLDEKVEQAAKARAPGGGEGSDGPDSRF